MFYQKLLKRKKEIETRLTELKQEVEKYPKGELHCRHNGAYIKWFHHHDGCVNYIPKRQKEFAQQLAIRKYKIAMARELETEKQAIEAYEKCMKRSPQKAIDLLDESSAFKPLLIPYFGTYDKNIDDWLRQSYEKNASHPEKLIHKTVAGYNVRSKSESLIVSALYMNHIPFRYECALHLDEVTVFPDFTIMHPYTGQIFYWEHFGMMDNPVYIDLTYKKLKTYAEYGIVPSINLITTFEAMDKPLDYEVLENLIQFYFL